MALEDYMSTYKYTYAYPVMFADLTSCTTLSSGICRLAPRRSIPAIERIFVLDQICCVGAYHIR